MDLHLLPFLDAIKRKRKVVITLALALDSPTVSIGSGTLPSLTFEKTDRLGPQGTESWCPFQEQNQECPCQEDERKGPLVIKLVPLILGWTFLCEKQIFTKHERILKNH